MNVMDRWIKDNYQKAKRLDSKLLPMRPDIGFYLNVQGFEISENLFPVEYNKILSAYIQVLDKIVQLNEKD